MSTAKGIEQIGGAIVALAVIASLIWTTVAFDRLNDEIARYPRVDALGEGAVRLQARKYILYLEGPESDENRHPVKIVMTHRRSERRVSAKPYKGSFSSYDEHDIPMTAVATVTPRRAGVYDVQTDGHEDLAGDAIVFGGSIAGRTSRILLVMGAFVVVGLGGMVLVIVGRARRRRERRPHG